jgi:FkbM family methyltransferase
MVPYSAPGKMWLSMLLLRNIRKLENLQLKDIFGNTFLVPSLQESPTFSLLINGVYEPETMACLFANLECGDSFIDVGSHIGLFSIPVAKKVAAGNGRVMSVDPHPGTVAYFRENMLLNKVSNIAIKMCAAYDATADTVNFSMLRGAHRGMSSITPDVKDWSVQVPAKTLDQLIDEEKLANIKIVKIDVEGYEAAVLRGASRLLRSESPPLIIFEFNEVAAGVPAEGSIESSQDLLRAFGYELWFLEDFLKGSPPLKRNVASGFHMIVGKKS